MKFDLSKVGGSLTLLGIGRGGYFFGQVGRFVGFTAMPATAATNIFYPAIEGGEACHNQKQKSIGGGVQSEVKKTVYQDSKTSSQGGESDPAPEVIARLATRYSLTEKPNHKEEREQSTHDAGIGKDLQIIVVRLFQSIKSIARIKSRINDAKCSQPRS